MNNNLSIVINLNAVGITDMPCWVNPAIHLAWDSVSQDDRQGVLASPAIICALFPFYSPASTEHMLPLESGHEPAVHNCA